MSSPSPTLAVARQLGTVLGLTEGLDGPTDLRMLPRAFIAFLDVVSAGLYLSPSSISLPPPLPLELTVSAPRHYA